MHQRLFRTDRRKLLSVLENEDEAIHVEPSAQIINDFGKQFEEFGVIDDTLTLPEAHTPEIDIMFPVTLDELRATLKRLKPRKAPGPDRITNKRLKAADHQKLIDIFNDWIEKRQIPVEMKENYTTLLPKKAHSKS